MLIKEIAEKTGIGESTVRFYMSKFPEFMFYKIEGRRKQYSPEIVEVIKFISDKYLDKWSAEQIREELGRKHNIIIEVDVKKEKEENSLIPIPGDQDFISVLVAQNNMLIEKIIGLEKAQQENAVEQQKNAAELKADYQRLSNELNVELHSVLAEERAQYQSRIQELESQVKEQQTLIIERLEVREKAIQEAIAAWREAAAATREEEKKPWWKFWV